MSMSGAPLPPGRVVLRPIGTPLPLGFFALTGATTLMSGLQLGWFPAADARTVGLAILAFAVVPQAIACVLGLLARDVVVGTGMGVLTGTWLAFGLVLVSGPAAAASAPLGALLVVAGCAMAAPAIGAAMGKVVPALVLATTSVRFLCTGVYELSGSDAWRVLSGWIGVVLAAVSAYAALALVLEDVAGRALLPVLRRPAGRRVAPGEGEAGVRRGV